MRHKTLFHIVIAWISLQIVSGGESRSVSTSWGIVRGELVSPNGEDLPPVAQYLGIPYGVAPSGQFRFNMAISAAKWTHMPKEAKKLSPVCLQTQLPELSETRALQQTSAQRFDHIHRLLPKLKDQSEDCLYMNLFVPERLERSQRENALPVIVLVHGDDYGWNAGNPYNGSILAAHSQIIVVTLNYRLGVFGFLGRCESSSCTGNSGISDLVSALTMLNVILPSFGGDPKAVTLMGWGSGASLVSLLMSSPLTQPGKRLFRRAILLDGTALSPSALTYNPQPYFMQLAENLGCVPMNRTSSFNEGIDGIVRCMQEHSSQNVTKAVQKIDIPTFLPGFAPIVDGQLIPNKPRISFSPQFGSLFREIDLMVGMTSNPAHHMLSNEFLLQGITKETREKIFRTLVRNLFEFHRSEILSAVLNEYTDWSNPRDHPKSIRNGVLSALGDVLFTSPLIETLRYHSSDEASKDANTFMFVFGHETRTWLNEQPNSGIRGSLSGDHVPYILGYPLNRGDKEDKLYSGFNAEDKGMARVMMHYVGNFVKSGDPSKPQQMTRNFPLGDTYHSTTWPQFDEKSRESYLEITDRPRIKNYYRNDKVGFWTGLVPQLHKAGQEGVTLPEEHHFLPNHMKRDTFFGRVRSFASFSNDPFPPPPLPPSPPPENIKKTTPKPPPTHSPTPEATVIQQGNYSTMLAVTISIGCGLLILNICIFMGLYRQCDKNKKSQKKLQLQYQTYSANHGTIPEPYNNMNSPLSLMPPPPPPLVPNQQQHQQHQHSLTHSLHEEMFERPLFLQQSNTLNNNNHQSSTNSCGNSLPRHSFQEQEPLLAQQHKTSSVGVRAGISPTCPRHGRAALAVQSSRGNSLVNSQQTAPLEEIQV